MTARSHTRINRKPIRRRGIRPRDGIAGLRMPDYRAPKASTLAARHALEKPDEEETSP